MSNDIAISVENLSKMYRIGARETSPENVRELLQHAAKTPFKYLTSRIKEQTEAETLWALHNVSFEVKRGECIGIIGRNGSGKSTLLKILSRITDPTEGRAIIRGRVNSLLEIGTGFHPELTGRENIYLSAAIYGMKRAEIDRKFDEIVAFSEIEKFLDTPVKRYSSGMYVRLAFAVAAHLEPDVLIVDEVLAVGDVAFQNKCLGRMGDVTRQGRTVLFVSHMMTAIKTLCQRAVLLEGGKVIKDDNSNLVIAHYLQTKRVSRSEIRWDVHTGAPGNECFRPHSVCVRNSVGRVATDFIVQEDIKIEMTYWSLISGQKMGATIMLFNDDHICILSSISNEETVWHGRPRPKALFRSICLIPRYLLAPGKFTISVLLWGENYRRSWREDDVIEFEVHDSKEGRGDYLGGWEGVIRPHLKWETEMISES